MSKERFARAGRACAAPACAALAYTLLSESRSGLRGGLEDLGPILAAMGVMVSMA